MSRVLCHHDVGATLGTTRMQHMRERQPLQIAKQMMSRAEMEN